MWGFGFKGSAAKINDMFRRQPHGQPVCDAAAHSFSWIERARFTDQNHACFVEAKSVCSTTIIVLVEEFRHAVAPTVSAQHVLRIL